MATEQKQNTASANVDLNAYDKRKYCEVPDDSNLQSTGVAGGADADHSIVTREGGSDAGYQAGYGAGGRELL